MPCVLRNYVTRNEPAINITISEAMLVTCATFPTFAPVTIRKDPFTFGYVSGEHGLSNPIREVILEAHHAYGDEATVACLLSIGCGHSGSLALPAGSGATTRKDFLERLLTDGEKTAREVGVQMGRLAIYHRFCVSHGISKEREWTGSDAVTAHTTIYLEDMEVVEAIAKCAYAIAHGEGFATLEQLSKSTSNKNIGFCSHVHRVFRWSKDRASTVAAININFRRTMGSNEFLRASIVR